MRGRLRNVTLTQEEIHRWCRLYGGVTSVIDTGGKFTTVFMDTGDQCTVNLRKDVKTDVNATFGKFAAGVNDTYDNFGGAP